MNWTLQSTGNPLEFVLLSDDNQKAVFKYSPIQQSIRMRFNEHFGVYVLDEGSFVAKKFSIRNIYGSEIGNVTKGSWRVTSGTLVLDDVPENFTYSINADNSLIEITHRSFVKNEVKVSGTIGEENYFLALIVFSWMQSVTAAHLAETF
jgi:hypothetical protein